MVTTKPETTDAALVLPLLRRQRDYVWRAIERERATANELADLPWLDRDALIEDLVTEFALLNAAIARRL